MKKIKELFSEMYLIVNDCHKKTEKAKNIIESCKNIYQVESCLNLIFSIEEQTYSFIKQFSKKNKFVNILSFGKISEVLKEETNKNIENLYHYYFQKYREFNIEEN